MSYFESKNNFKSLLKELKKFNVFSKPLRGFEASSIGRVFCSGRKDYLHLKRAIADSRRNFNADYLKFSFAVLYIKDVDVIVDIVASIPRHCDCWIIPMHSVTSGDRQMFLFAYYEN